MNRLGINQGTSGNISLRHGDGMLITPTSVPYETMKPEQIVFMELDGSCARTTAIERMALSSGYPQGPARSERGRSCASAICNDPRDHGPRYPAGALHDRRGGGDIIRCAPYATFGTEELSRHAVAALEDRWPACWLIMA